MNEVRRYRPADAVAVWDPNSMLGEDSTYVLTYDGLGGLNLGKAIKNVGKAVVKGVKDVGHATGAVVTSKVGKAVIGTALAATGVGIPAAAAIGAGTQGVGALIKKGGNLGKAAKGAAVGAAGGVVASGAGKLIAKTGVGQSIQSKAQGIANKLLPGNPFKPKASDIPKAQPMELSPMPELPPPSMMADKSAINRKIAGKVNRSPDGSLLSTLGKGVLAATPVIKRLPGAGAVTEATDAAERAGRGARTAGRVKENVSKARGEQKKLSDRARSLGGAAKKAAEKAGELAAAGDSLGAEKLADEARRLAGLAAAAGEAAVNAGDMADRIGAGVVAGTNAGIMGMATNDEDAGTLGGMLKNPLVLGGLAVGAMLLTRGGSSSRTTTRYVSRRGR